MSYILDALKKSEQERRRGKSPDLLSVQDAMPNVIKKRPILNYLVLTALLLNAFFIVLWLKPNHSKNTVSISMPSEEIKPVAIEDKSSPIEKNTAKEEKSEKAVPPSAVEKASGNENNTSKKKSVPEKFDLQPSATTQQPAVTSRVTSESKPLSESVPPPSENRIYNRNELPKSVQQALPDFNITVSIYSENPAARMVKINGQILHEGESLSAGLRLEAIEPNGAIMSYQNYHFRIGLR